MTVPTIPADSCGMQKYLYVPAVSNVCLKVPFGAISPESQVLPPAGTAASAAVAALLGSSVDVWATELEFFQVTVPPFLMVTVAGSNVRLSVMSTVAASVAAPPDAAPEAEPEADAPVEAAPDALVAGAVEVDALVDGAVDVEVLGAVLEPVVEDPPQAARAIMATSATIPMTARVRKRRFGALLEDPEV